MNVTQEAAAHHGRTGRGAHRRRATAAAYGLTGHDGSYSRPSGIPASIPDSQVNLMELSPVPARPAPGFTLTDQDGRVLPLSAFHGKVVVLEFMDPHCTDICPIVSAEFTDAYRDLGRQAGQVVFAAVNVNQYHHAVADVAAYSRAHQLTSIPSWHFLTGPAPRLRAVWNAYNITVQAPGPDADIVHSSVVYFIDPGGRERYLASPQADHTTSGASYLPADQIAAWGRGIAQVATLLAGWPAERHGSAVTCVAGNRRWSRSGGTRAQSRQPAVSLAYCYRQLLLLARSTRGWAWLPGGATRPLI